MTNNKIVIITGASKGIGLATANYFLQNHWQVINISRNACPIKEVINLNADLSTNHWEQSIQDSLQQNLQKPTQVCLIHNSAFYLKDNMVNIKSSQLRDALEVNVIAPTLLNHLLLPMMQKGSSIIYIGSTLSEKAISNAASYIISKHAVVGMMRATCQDLAGYDIHTCCICPGFTDTEMLRDHLQGDEKIYDMIKNKVTFKRLIKPDEIAGFIYFCANNPVINGSVLHANLGQIES